MPFLRILAAASLGMTLPTGVLADDLAIHQDVADALRGLGRVAEIGVFPERLQVKHHQVGKGPGVHSTATCDAERTQTIVKGTCAAVLSSAAVSPRDETTVSAAASRNRFVAAGCR